MTGRSLSSGIGSIDIHAACNARIAELESLLRFGIDEDLLDSSLYAAKVRRVLGLEKSTSHE